MGPFGGPGGAWLSSARVVRCWVKSRNERNPRSSCQHVMAGTHGDCRGQLGGRWDDVKSSCPYVLGFTHATMAGTKGCKPRGGANPKTGLSSDWGLQLDPMKSESLVIADQQRCGEYVPGPCTHRPSHHESPVTPEAGGPTLVEGAVEGGTQRLGLSRNKVAVPEGAAGSLLSGAPRLNQRSRIASIWTNAAGSVGRWNI